MGVYFKRETPNQWILVYVPSSSGVELGGLPRIHGDLISLGWLANERAMLAVPGVLRGPGTLG